MRIKIINPNTTLSMTESIVAGAGRAVRQGTEVYGASPKTGPESIECYVDEYLAIPGVLEEIVRGDREENADAYVIACFCDPGLQAAREITQKPVVGIAEAAIAVSKLIAPSFSIVSVLDRSYKTTEDVVKANGAWSFCRSIRSTGLGVLEFGENPGKGLEALIREGKRAVEQDGAECILLGCAGFVEFVREMNRALPVPVLDGVVPAVKLAEALVDMGLQTCKRSTWSYPQPKAYTGYDSIFFDT